MLRDRIASKIVADGAGCWLWTAYVDRDGYGRCGVGERVLRAHRVVYELLVGPIPEGLTLDHLCRVRNCVNPDHLEPVTRGENTLRGATIPAANRIKTHCVMGHEYTPENTRLYAGSRYCRACHRLKRAAERKRAQLAPH